MLSRTIIPALLTGALLAATPRLQAQITTLPAHPPASIIDAAEYFFDADPGYGNGHPLSIGSGGNLSATPVIPLNALGKGAHRLFVRSRNTAGNWSMTENRVFVIYSLIQALPQLANGTAVANAEYFIDTDPGIGSGTAIQLPGPGADLSATNVPIDVSALPLGIHRVFFRTQNTEGQWSLGTGSTFTILINTVSQLPPHPTARPVSTIEYFIDTDPGFGNGTIMAVSPTNDLANQSVAVDITGLSTGAHTLFFRSLNGHSMTTAQRFSIGGTALPVSWLNVGIHREGGQPMLSWTFAKTGGHSGFRIERSADGSRFAPIGSLDAEPGNGAATYSFLDADPLPGLSYYRVRVQGSSGTDEYSPVLAYRSQEMTPEIRINNPVGNMLQLKRIGTGAEAFDVRILNQAGQLVMHPGTAGGPVQNLDVSALSPGIYLLSWQDPGGPQVLRFIKQ